MRGKLEAGYYIERTGQLENRPASWKLNKLEFSGRTRELESWKFQRSWKIF